MPSILRNSLTLQDINRFWSKVSQSSGDNCWLWLASTNREGYGYFYFNYAMFKAHRVSWIIAYGDIAPGMLILHRCDNPSCVNPSHLFSGTNQDNTNDKKAKGREHHPVGAKNPNCKLTEADVLKIREVYGEGFTTQAELSRRYKISVTHVRFILNRKSWANI